MIVPRIPRPWRRGEFLTLRRLQVGYHRGRSTCTVVAAGRISTGGEIHHVPGSAQTETDDGVAVGAVNKEAQPGWTE